MFDVYRTKPPAEPPPDEEGGDLGELLTLGSAMLCATGRVIVAIIGHEVIGAEATFALLSAVFIGYVIRDPASRRLRHSRHRCSETR